MTWNNIVFLFNGIADTNPFIARFGNGDMEDIETKGPTELLYPILWIVPQNVNIGDNSLEWNIRVLVFEPDDIDDTKQTVILSDTLQILHDVIKTLQFKLSNDITITNIPITCQPFAHRFVDYCVGWYCDITLSTEANNSPCNIPGY